MLPRRKSTLSAFLALKCISLTKFWPMRQCLWQFLEHSPRDSWCMSLALFITFPFLLPFYWTSGIMAGPGGAILTVNGGHASQSCKVEPRFPRPFLVKNLSCGLEPTHNWTVPLLTLTSERNKLLSCFSHCYKKFHCSPS